MADGAGVGQTIAPIGSVLAEIHAGQPLQTWLIGDAGRPAATGAEEEPMKRRAAAGFQVRLVPHRLIYRSLFCRCKPAVMRFGLGDVTGCLIGVAGGRPSGGQQFKYALPKSGSGKDFLNIC